MKNYALVLEMGKYANVVAFPESLVSEEELEDHVFGELQSNTNDVFVLTEQEARNLKSKLEELLS